MTSVVRGPAQPNLRYITTDDNVCIYLVAGDDGDMFTVPLGEVLIDLGKDVYVAGDRYRKVKVARPSGEANYAAGYINLGGATATASRVALLL
jgi:hypothetical protein